MRRLDEVRDRLDLFDDAPVLRFQISDLLSDVRLFIRELRIFLIINLFRKRIVDKLLDKRISPPLVAFEPGEEFRFFLLGIHPHSRVAFLRSIDNEADDIVVDAVPFELLAEEFDELFLAHVRLRAFVCAEGLGAAIIDVPLLLLRRNPESALATDEEAAVIHFPCVRPVGGFPALHDCLRLVEQLFRDDRLMRADMGLPLPPEHSAIDRIGQDPVDDGLENDPPSFAGTEVLLLQFLGDRDRRMKLRDVEFESFPDEFRFLLDDHQPLRLRIAPIAERRRAGVFSATYLLRKTAFHVLAQIADVLRRHGKLDARHHDIVLGIVFAVEGADLFDRLVLEHPLYRPFVHGIPGKPVDFPAKDPFGFSFFDKIDHLGEYRTPRFLRRLRFLKDFHYLEIIPSRDLLHLDDLRLDRNRLAVIALRGFSRVNDVSHICPVLR